MYIINFVNYIIIKSRILKHHILELPNQAHLHLMMPVRPVFVSSRLKT